jgi:site-specific recombinase XerD
MEHLLEPYAQWLKALNFDGKNSTREIPRMQAFMRWLRKNNIHQITQVDSECINRYFEELSCKINIRTCTVLTVNTLRDYLKSLRRFSRYLRESGQGHFEVSIIVPSPPINKGKDSVLTEKEVQSLYEACADDYLGLRDRAMLSVCYGCGLRRTESSLLELQDILFNRGILHVRCGKNFKERYVPMTCRVMSDLKEYLTLSRPVLCGEKESRRFFIGINGNGIDPATLNIRFEKLKAVAGIQKPGNIHILRHSIATHLLQKGMSFEQIAKFLGHSSLESTQIYTHIINDL